MSTSTVGNAAESAVLDALVQRGFRVLVPFGDGHPYDIVIHLGDERFSRVQCKNARERSGCLQFNSRSTDHGQGAGTYRGLADLFGVYLPGRQAVFIVPVLDVPESVAYLRLEPAKNNQRAGVRWAADYNIDAWAERIRIARSDHRRASAA